MADDDTVGAKVAKIVAQLTPRRQHRDLDVVDDGKRKAGALGQPPPLVAVDEGKAAVVTNRGPQHSHVVHGWCAEARDHESAIVQLVRAQFGQNVGDFGDNATGGCLQILIARPIQGKRYERPTFLLVR